MSRELLRENENLRDNCRRLEHLLNLRIAQVDRLSQLVLDAEARYEATREERDWWHEQYNSLVALTGGVR